MTTPVAQPPLDHEHAELLRRWCAEFRRLFKRDSLCQKLLDDYDALRREDA